MSPADGDAYVEASIGDATYLNPLIKTDSASGDICDQVYNGLVKYDKNIVLVGDLAESWEVKRGGLELIFHLKKGVKWHDGQQFLADDVKFTYERLVDPKVKTPYSSDYEIIQSVEVLDPWTVRVIYKEPFAPALESWGIGIVPKHIFETGDFNTHPANRRPIGTGPYKFHEWKTDEKIVLTANPDYFEGKPRISRFIYRIIPDTSVQFLELRRQGIDVMGLTPDQYDAYEELFKHYNKYRYPSFSYVYLAMNLGSPLFSDKRVRRAMAHALDKNEIIQGVLLGKGRPATGPFPPQSWAYDPSIEDYAYDPALAESLLSQAGWVRNPSTGLLEKGGKPFEFTILSNQGNKLREMCAVIIQSRLAAMGIKVHVRIIEWSSFLHNFVDKRKFDAVVLAWNLPRDPDPYAIWHSSQIGEGKYNFVGFQNAEVDRLLVAGRREFDIEKRKKIYHAMHRILADELPYIFLYYPDSLPVVHKRFVGPELAPAGLGWNFPKWYVPAAAQLYRDAAS